MQSVHTIGLSKDEFDDALLVLRMVDSALPYVKIYSAYADATKLVAKVSYGSTIASFKMWSKLTALSDFNLITVAVCKELVQLKNNIDADDSLVDFFGWLLVAKRLSINVNDVLSTIKHRLSTQ
jgi:hypothetical protein